MTWSGRRAIARVEKVNPRLQKLPGAAGWLARGFGRVAGESRRAPRLPKYSSRDSARANPGRSDLFGSRVRHLGPRAPQIFTPARHFGPDLPSRGPAIGILGREFLESR